MNLEQYLIVENWNGVECVKQEITWIPLNKFESREAELMILCCSLKRNAHDIPNRY